MITGTFLAIAAVLLGIWSKPNAVEAQKRFYVIASFACFMPLSFFVGYIATEALTFPIFVAPIFGVIGFVLQKPIERYLRKHLRAGDGPTAAYFFKLAEKDGKEVKRVFMIKALEKKAAQTTQRSTVDQLIWAYNEARVECGLEPTDINEAEIPYV